LIKIRISPRRSGFQERADNQRLSKKENRHYKLPQIQTNKYNGKGSKNSDFGLAVRFERKSLFGVFQNIMQHVLQRR
jgi:hypothetical protein